MSRPKLTFSAPVLARIVADASMVNAALLLALVGRYVWLVGVEGGAGSPRESLREHVSYFSGNWWLITLICLLVFTLTGFYSHSRMYEHRYKALVITEAVSLSYLLFSFALYFGWDLIEMPRSALLPAWVLTLALVIGVRAFYYLSRGGRRAFRKPPVARAAGNAPLRTLLIGGAGYIGSALLEQLLRSGRRVRLYDMLMYGTGPIHRLLEHPNLEIVRADFREVDQIVQAMQGVDEVIHLGGIVGDPACALDEEVTIEVNLMATRMIAEVAKGCGVRRFVFASTCSVYGACDQVLDEHSLARPISLYAQSKLASEHVLLEMTTPTFAPSILRFATVFGLSGRIRFDLVVNVLTAKAVTEGEMTVNGGGQWRPFIHVLDAARAIMAVLEAPLPLVAGQVFNAGGNELNHTIDEIADKIKALVPAARVVRNHEAQDRRNYRVSFDKVRRTLGFKPQWTIEQGVRQIIEAIRLGAVSDYRDVEYSNAGFLRHGQQGQNRVLLRLHRGWERVLLDESGSYAQLPPAQQEPTRESA